MKTTTFILPCMAVLCALRLEIYRSQTPHPITYRNLTPQIDPAAPRSQNGLKLTDIQKSHREFYTLIFHVPDTPVVSKAFKDIHDPYTPHDAFHIKAISSQGYSWKLGWRVHDDPKYWSSVAINADLKPIDFDTPALVADLPLAYPPGTKWVDIEMRNRRGAKARWRVTNLQTAKNIVPVPADRPNVYAKDGIFLRLEGQWAHWDSRPHQQWQGWMYLSGCMKPRPGRVWKIEPTGGQPQWISHEETQGPLAEEQRIAIMKGLIKPVANANLNNTKLMFRHCIWGQIPTVNKYGVMYFDLLEYEVTPDGTEKLLSTTPLSLAAQLKDKGSMEQLYPKALQRLPSRKGKS